MPKPKKALRLSARRPGRSKRSAGRGSSSAFLESLLAHGGSCIAVVEGQALRYTLVSPDYQAIAPGVPMLGRTYRQVFPEAADHGAEARLRHVLDTGEPWRVDEYHAPIAGKPDATWQGKVVRLPLEAGQEPAALIVLLDVTERKRAQEAMRVNEQQLRLALQAGHMGTWAWDVATDTIISDPLHRLIWDLPADEPRVSHSLLMSRIHPEDAHKVLTREQLAQICGPFDIEFRIRRRDGQVRWLRCSSTPLYDERGTLRRMIGVNFDITDHKLAEEALRQSEHHFRQVVESLAPLVWTCQPEGACDYLSPQWVSYTGLPAAQQLGFGWLEQLHPEDRQTTHTSWQESLARGATFEGEYRLRRHDGVYRSFRISAVPIRDKDGRITKWFGSNTDVTEMRAAQQVLARSKEELERLVAERTAKLQELVGELEHFSYTITHDMRAPLRSMRGFAELVLEMGEACPPAEQQELLNRVVTAAERMDLLIMDALSYSQAVRQQLPLGPVDLGTLLRGMLDTYPEFQAAKAQIQVQGNLPSVLGNQAGLTQVFSNLLGNAIKFTKPGQVPEIRVWAEAAQSAECGTRNGPDGATAPHFALRTPPSPLVRVWVEDQGIGISPSMLPRVFNMFARGHTGHPGTGIGLALVRKVIDRMGGRVGVLSEEGRGSRFWLELLPGDPRLHLALPLPLPPPGPGAIL